LTILTFATTSFPTTIMIGYEDVNVRPHIPKPLKCRHPTKFCKSPKVCNKCSEPHTPGDENCTNAKSSSKCKHNANIQTNHSPLDKQCPTFIKQKEIVAIKTIERVDFKTAINIYATHINQQHTLKPFNNNLSLQH